MKETCSIRELGRNPSAVVRFAARKGSVPITKDGRVQAVLVSKERLEALLEQMEILANPRAMAAIRRAKAGKRKEYPLSVLDED